MGTPQDAPRRLRQKRRRAKKETDRLLRKVDKQKADDKTPPTVKSG